MLALTRIDSSDLDASDIDIGLYVDLDGRLRYLLAVERDADAVIAGQLGLVPNLEHFVTLLLDVIGHILVLGVGDGYANVT